MLVLLSGEAGAQPYDYEWNGSLRIDPQLGEDEAIAFPPLPAGPKKCTLFHQLDVSVVYPRPAQDAIWEWMRGTAHPFAGNHTYYIQVTEAWLRTPGHENDTHVEQVVPRQLDLTTGGEVTLVHRGWAEHHPFFFDEATYTAHIYKEAEITPNGPGGE